MKYIDEFRDNKIAKNISRAIFEKAGTSGPVNIMEVCGTHTMSICNFGIRDMLPENINLISGPGCPVCVTPKAYIDRAVALAGIQDTVVTTFGDMMKVPGSRSSLTQERTKGASVKVVYSTLDAVDIAEKNPDKKVIFLGIGFETTSPTVAASLAYAKKKRLKNFFVYSGHKVILPAMKALMEDRDAKIDAFLCPAHVSTIIGMTPYNIIATKYKTPCVITGFEPLDILQGILMIIEQITSKRSEVENQYKRIATRSGNKKALDLLDDVFEIEDSEWRSIGIIPKSGMRLKRKYSVFDVEKNFDLPAIKTRPDTGCMCGSVLKGIKTPFDCPLFNKKCTPEHPVGPCMVSSEGTCAAYYRYPVPQGYGAGRR
ncbi:MAG: hydrogenase formation protein HypD [Candidatus Omnitrophica bacterium]|nr:hydrogenase formation protein HypD [Candidatus Omnitrophota bacterium]MBU4590439.1 hydrogenase formation protein HypD [Candidatus Omnitrophota bacterium]